MEGSSRNQWRLRSGDWRVIYEIHDQQLFVDVVKIGGRGQATLYKCR